MANRIGLVIVAAGQAVRMEGIDKAWTDLGGRPLIWHSISRLGHLAHHIALVVRSDSVQPAQRLFQDEHDRVSVVAGGVDRRESVLCGLDALPRVDTVAVHDGARPFADPTLVHAGVACLEHCHGAVPAVPVSDTIKQITDQGMVLRTLERSVLRAVQTPQVFRAATLLQVHRTWQPTGLETDDASMLETKGYRVMVYGGDARNFKVTTPLDLDLARLVLQREAKASFV